jgi:hypothetical protein
MRLRSAGLAMLAVSVLAGCGGVSASVADLRQDAAAICRQVNHRFRGLAPPAAGEAQDASFLSSGSGRLQEQLQQLRRVTPPRDVATVYRAGLGALGQELTALNGAVAAIHRGADPGMAYRALGRQLRPLESQVNQAWQALQIADCLQ